MQGLAVSRVVNVTVSFAPIATPLVNFDTLLILGDSNVVDTGEVMREYNRMSDVAHDFGTTAPEYQAALLYFSQLPPPATLFIGRWASAPTSGGLVGGFLSNAQKLIASWNAITAGGFKIFVDGATTGVDISALNFASANNPNSLTEQIISQKSI